MSLTYKHMGGPKAQWLRFQTCDRRDWIRSPTAWFLVYSLRQATHTQESLFLKQLNWYHLVCDWLGARQICGLISCTYHESSTHSMPKRLKRSSLCFLTVKDTPHILSTIILSALPNLARSSALIAQVSLPYTITLSEHRHHIFFPSVSKSNNIKRIKCWLLSETFL